MLKKIIVILSLTLFMELKPFGGASGAACYAGSRSGGSYSAVYDNLKSTDVNLIIGVRYNELSTIKEAIKKGANINYLFEDETSIQLAVREGNTKIIKFLLDNKANPTEGLQNIAVEHGLRLYDNRSSILKLLLEYKADINNSRAIYNSLTTKYSDVSIENLTTLQKLNVEISSEALNDDDDETGQTALIQAVINNKDQLIIALFNHDRIFGQLDIGKMDNDGKSAIDFALESKNLDIIYEFYKYANEHANIILAITKLPKTLAWLIVRLNMGNVPLLTEHPNPPSKCVIQ